MALSQYLTVTEVADKLKVSKRTISRWIHEGWVTPVRIGRIIRFDERELESAVRTHGDDPVTFHCTCAGPHYCHEPMKSWPEAKQYGSGADHGEFPDDPDDGFPDIPEAAPE